MAKALTELRERKDVKWTYISPAGDFQAEGERSGKNILGGEELTLNAKGESIISYADYAIAMVDEAVKGAVSYTHLDVYKRQLLDAMIRYADLLCRVFGPEEEQLRGYPGHEEIELALMKPVSYTHLDVYKRQEFSYPMDGTVTLTMNREAYDLEDIPEYRCV